MGDKQDKLVLETEEVTTPLTEFTQNIMGTSVVTVKPKMKTIQTKTCPLSKCPYSLISTYQMERGQD